MANAAVAFNNLVDLTTTSVSASGFITFAPPSRLTGPHVGNKWRDNAASTFVLAGIANSSPIDTLMLAGLSGVAPSFRVRLSSSDSSGAAGDVFDSGTISGLPYWDADYAMFVYLLPSPLNAKFARVDISEGGVPYIEAGRYFVGARSAFTNNLQAPWVRAAVRGSVDIMGVGGQTFVDLRRGHWRINASFNFLTEAQRITFIEDISTAIIQVGHLDMLFIRDTASIDLPQDSTWGYIDGEFVQTQSLYGVNPPLYTVEFPIRQRL